MPDKWSQYAAPSAGATGTPAPQAGKWDQYAVADDEPPAAPSAFQQFRSYLDTSTTPSTETDPGLRALDNFGRGVAGGTVGVLNHPLLTLKSMVDQMRDVLPGPGGMPNVQGTQNILRQGQAAIENPAYTAGQFIGPALVTHAFTGAPEGAMNLRSRFGNPEPSFVGAPERAVRNTVKSLNLPVNHIEPTVEALMGPNGDAGVAGIIRSYAERAGKPINSPLDAAKVASKAADDMRAFYKSKLLEPNSGETVSVRGKSPIGTGEGQYASLGQIDARIADLNKQLSEAYRAEANGNPSAIAKAPLEEEARALRSILYDNLSRKTGMPATHIESLRETYGKLYSASDSFTRAANQVRERSQIPSKSLTEALVRGGKKLRGGEEGVLNRKFRGTLPDLPGRGPGLPEIPGAAPASPVTRVPLWTGPSSEPRPELSLTPDTEGAQAVMERALAKRASERAAKQAIIDAQIEAIKKQRAENIAKHGIYKTQ